MPRLDKYHEVVKNALIKDGWEIKYDPFLLKYKGLRLYIDLGAEKITDGQKVTVEIKVFGSDSFVNDFEKAIGQYSLYKFILKRANFKQELYLAVSQQTFEMFGDKPAIGEYIAENEIYLVIFNPDTEKILQWIK